MTQPTAAREHVYPGTYDVQLSLATLDQKERDILSALLRRVVALFDGNGRAADVRRFAGGEYLVAQARAAA